jgi:dTDP-4-amino-4,6-dideoxygalactose transaminase
MTTLSYDRARGHATSYDVVDVGYNYRLDDLRAALGVVQLKKLETDVARRALLRERYLAGLDGLSGLHIPFLENRESVSNYIFPVVLKGAGNAGRNAIRSRLAEKGIETSVHYPAVHRFTNYRDDARPLPETEMAADNLVSLPMYFGLAESQVDFIVEAVREVLGSAEVLEMCSRSDLPALR